MIYVFVRRLFVSLWLSAGIALALLLCSSLAGQCAADSATPGPQVPDLAEMSIKDLMNITVVTAGKRPETIANTAAAVFVITHEDIERYGYQTLAQSLRRISGFFTEYDRGYNTIGARGYLPNCDLNRRVLVLVDGHKYNDYLYGQGPVDQDLPVDMRDIERIEIVKGPGSALWGSEALLCVINCITKTASQMDGLEIRQDLGWWKGQRVAYGRSNPGGLEISGSVSQLESEGQQRIYFSEFDTPEDNNGVAVGLDGERVERGYVNMSYKGYRLYYNHVMRTKDVPTAYWGSVFNTPGVDVKDERSSWEMSYENPTPYAGNGKLFVRAYQDNYDCVLNWIELHSGVDHLVVNRGIDLSRSWGAEARYSRNISSRVSATLGAEYLRAYNTKRRNFDLDPYDLYTNRVGDYTLNSYYMQTDWDVTDSLRLVAGTRLDDHTIFGANWSPRMGLIYKASPKSTLKLLYGQAFRSPSMSEIRTNDNPFNLQPEKINTTELVWERQMGNNSRLVTSLYEFEMCDIILNRSGVVDTRTHARNVGGVTSRGIETQYDYQLRNGGSGYLGLSVMNSEASDFISPSPLLSSPRFVAACGLSVPVFGDRAYLASDLQYMGSRETLAGNVVYGAAIANLALTSSSLIKGADISLGVSNLFNTPVFAPPQPKNYAATHDGSGVDLDRIPQGERTLQFQVSYHM